MQRADERADQGTALYLTANLFAVAFGLAGLAQAWSAVTHLAGSSDWPGTVLWIVAALTWLVTLVGYLANVAAQRRWKTELSDPTFGPFTALIVIVPMLLGARLAEEARRETLSSGAAQSWSCWLVPGSRGTGSSATTPSGAGIPVTFCPRPPVA